jgi:type I restriction enzyme S subunit
MVSEIPKVEIGASTIHVSDGNYSSKYPKSHEFLESGIPFVSANNLRDGRIIRDNLKFISEVQHAALRKGHVRTGDVLLVTRGSLGLTALVTSEFNDVNINAQLVLLRADNITVDARYLFFVANSPDFQSQVIRNASGTAQPQLPIGPLKRLTIPLPLISIQRRIAGILSAYDELIENSQRRIKILESMARALYREWFVHFRFPGHESVPRVPSPLGEIPQGWEVRPFGEIYNTSSGGTPSRKRPEYFDGGSIDWVKSQELLDKFILSTEERITPDAIANSSAKVFPPNTVLVALYGATIGMLAIISGEAATNQACCAVLPKSSAYGREFAFLTLLTNRERIIGLRLGAAQQNISQVLLRNFECIKPPTKIATQFAEHVSPLFDGILNLQRQIQNLRRTRDLLLPRLLSGQIDVEALDHA